MKVLCVGDVCGKTGRQAFERFLPELKKKYKPDWVIVNGENATGVHGLSCKHARFLKDSGADIITTGNHLFARHDWHKLVEEDKEILRPHNLGPEDSPGSGLFISQGKRADTRPEIAVINVAGRVFMERARCPFETVSFLLQKIPDSVPVIIDFHAEATSEKHALFWFFNGRAAAVVGTHTHVQTSDARILSGGTAVITDLGMTGALNSILGVETDTIVGRFLNGYSERFQCGVGFGKIEGAAIEIDETKKAISIEPFRLCDHS